MKVSIAVRRTGLQIADQLGGWPRKAAAVLCLALAAGSALSHTRASSTSEQVSVVSAARDLSAGRVLEAGDVQLAVWPVHLVPPAAERGLARVLGHTIAAAVNSGEPITSARLRGRGVAAGLPRGTVATTVLLDDDAALSILQPGDVIDLISGADSDNPGAGARVVAHSARVLAVVAGSADDDAGGGSVVIAVTQSSALAIAGVGGRPLNATLRGPP